MTVSYTDEVATSSPLAFIKLLFKWRGSVYKLLFKDLLAYLALYYLITFTYIFALKPHQQVNFEKFIKEVRKYSNSVPLSFVLGFFVANVMTRWWNQYQALPWPTSTAVYVSSTLHGYDEVGRAMRRTIIRYLCLSCTMVLRVLSTRVKKRFPKMIDMIDAGLLNENECKIIEDLEAKFPGHSKNWLPIVWAASIVTRARREGRISDDFAAKTIIKQLDAFRGKLGTLMAYNKISIPLVYTQVVSIATYTYFLILLLSNQHVGPFDEGIMFLLDFIPLLTILQFIFYMGWLKVSEVLMNPFGDDDDDFEVNSMIDRNLQMGYLIVDDMHNDHPELLKDQYWDEIPTNLPDKGKSDDSEEKQFLDTEIVDYELIRKRSSGSVVKILPKIKEKEPKEPLVDSQPPTPQKIAISIPEDEIGNELFQPITPLPSVIFLDQPLAQSSKLKPDASVISEKYKKIENVEAEQEEINLAIRRISERKIGEKIDLDEDEEEEDKKDENK